MNRLEKKGGGIALMCKQEFKPKLILHESNNVMDFGVWKIKISGKDVTLVGIDHPPP